MLKNKKFTSIAVLTGLLLFLAGTWFWLETSYFYAFQDEKTHSLLQEKAQLVLADYVEKARPEVQQIVFHKVWTENTVNPNKIKIFFSYTLVTDEADTGGEFSMESEAYLIRESVESSDWHLSGFQVKESLLDFSEPLLIKASDITEE